MELESRRAHASESIRGAGYAVDARGTAPSRDLCGRALGGGGGTVRSVQHNPRIMSHARALPLARGRDTVLGVAVPPLSRRFDGALCRRAEERSGGMAHAC